MKSIEEMAYAIYSAITGYQHIEPVAWEALDEDGQELYIYCAADIMKYLFDERHIFDYLNIQSEMDEMRDRYRSYLAAKRGLAEKVEEELAMVKRGWEQSND